jgi:hypothetical protein
MRKPFTASWLTVIDSTYIANLSNRAVICMVQCHRYGYTVRGVSGSVAASLASLRTFLDYAAFFRTTSSTLSLHLIPSSSQKYQRVSSSLVHTSQPHLALLLLLRLVGMVGASCGWMSHYEVVASCRLAYLTLFTNGRCS